jgi:YbbR domain-containing protein
MNINFTNENNPSVESVEFAEKSEQYTKKGFKKVDILIFITCFLAAFFIWCYANYVNDPIIIKEVTVEFVLVNAPENESINPSKKKISVYGEKSVLNSITNNTITIYVDRSEFEGEDKNIKYDFKCPSGIHSHVDTFDITLEE